MAISERKKSTVVFKFYLETVPLIVPLKRGTQEAEGGLMGVGRREKNEFKLDMLSFRCMGDTEVKKPFKTGRKKVRE